MEYPGNADLSTEAQERVLSTFRKVVANLQAGRRDDAVVGLDFVLRLDPDFRPAVALHSQLEGGATDIDLGAIVAELQTRSEGDITSWLVEAVDLFNDRRFLDAKEIVERALLELPGHKDARDLLKQIQDSLKIESRVADYLTQAREALSSGDPEGSANFVLMAQTLDPHHPGIAEALSELEAHGGFSAPQEPPAEDAGPAEEGETFDFSFDAVPGPAEDEQPAELSFAEDGGGNGLSGDSEAPAELSFEPTGELGDDAEAFAPEGGGDESSGYEFRFDEASGELDTVGDEESAPEPSVDFEDLDDEVAEFVEAGQAAFDAGRYQEAIDTWSRIYLTDPSSQLAGERIDAARQRLEEAARELEIAYNSAADAAEEGRTDEALELVQQVLDRQPDHLAAQDLRDRLARESRTPSARGEDESGAEGEGDDALAAPGAALGEDSDGFSALPDAEEIEEAAFDDRSKKPIDIRKPQGGLPTRTILLAVAAVLLVVATAWMGLKVFSGGGGNGETDQAAVREALTQAQQLFEEHRIQEALHLLEGVQASELDQGRIDRRIAKYRQALVPPTPTPVPAEFARATAMLEEGRVIAAYRLVREQLADRPQDPGLLALRDRIRAREPLVSSLDRAIERNNPGTALSLSKQLVEQHPDSPEAQKEIDRWLFNSARAELMEYNFTGAEVLLQDLARRRPDDAEVRRVLEFIDTYKRRSVDMQLKIFINSLDQR